MISWIVYLMGKGQQGGCLRYLDYYGTVWMITFKYVVLELIRESIQLNDIANLEKNPHHVHCPTVWQWSDHSECYTTTT